MIVDTKKSVVQSSGINREEFFGIKEENLPYVFSILRNNLYTDKLLAILREYCSNAYDAHIELGKEEEPFHVQIPTALSPYYRIRDYGPGLSEDDIFNVFGSYGCSTKRGSNKTIGGFGIGSKSAFAYTDSFSVTSFFNGTEYVYEAFIDESGIGKIAQIFNQDTDEPNGLLISVKIVEKDIVAFRDKAKRFFSTFTGICTFNEPSWTTGHGVNGQAIIKQNDTVKMCSAPTDSFYYHHQRIYLKLGLIEYNIDKELISETKLAKFNTSKVKAVIDGDKIGGKPSANRETYEATEEFKTKLKKEIDDFVDFCCKEHDDDLKKIKTVAEGQKWLNTHPKVLFFGLNQLQVLEELFEFHEKAGFSLEYSGRFHSCSYYRDYSNLVVVVLLKGSTSLGISKHKETAIKKKVRGLLQTNGILVIYNLKSISDENIAILKNLCHLIEEENSEIAKIPVKLKSKETITGLAYSTKHKRVIDLDSKFYYFETYGNYSVIINNKQHSNYNAGEERLRTYLDLDESIPLYRVYTKDLSKLKPTAINLSVAIVEKVKKVFTKQDVENYCYKTLIFQMLRDIGLVDLPKSSLIYALEIINKEENNDLINALKKHIEVEKFHFLDQKEFLEKFTDLSQDQTIIDIPKLSSQLVSILKVYPIEYLLTGRSGIISRVKHYVGTTNDLLEKHLLPNTIK